MSKSGDGNIDDFGTAVEDSSNKIQRAEPCGCEAEPSYNCENMGNGSFTQWAVLSNNRYMPTYNTIKKINCGIYELGLTQNDEIVFTQKQINTDDWIVFPDSQSSEILKEIDLFWDQEKAFKKYGFTHKRGIILYGPAGNGKSILVKQAMHNLISSNKGIVINVFTTMGVIQKGIEFLKQIEQDKKIILIIEDIDAYISRYGEEDLLSFLDGEGSQNNILVIATTNYPEKLDKRIVSRPRRFDRRIKINMPSALTRKIYFEKKLNITGNEVDKYVKATEGFSFAAMAELVISTKCLNKDFDESIKIIKELISVSVSSSDFDSKVGF